ncbi:hypothetical protein B296_00053145, partial [Ensete ventricosum]
RKKLRCSSCMKRKETPLGEFSCIGGYSCIWSWKKRSSFDEYETEEIELGMGRTGACRYWDRDIITQLPLIPLLDGTFGSEATRCSCHGDVETTTADGIWRRDGALGEPPTAGVHIRRPLRCTDRERVSSVEVKSFGFHVEVRPWVFVLRYTAREHVDSA